LAALETGQTQATSEQATMLEKLRGQRITSKQAELEAEEWARQQQMKESQWGSALGGEQLRASAYGSNAANELAGWQTQVGVQMSDADRALQAAIAAANQGNAQWEQGFSQSQFDYQRQLDAAKAAQRGVSTPTDTSKNYLIPGTIEWYRYQQILNGGNSNSNNPPAGAVTQDSNGNWIDLNGNIVKQ